MWRRTGSQYKYTHNQLQIHFFRKTGWLQIDYIIFYYEEIISIVPSRNKEWTMDRWLWRVDRQESWWCWGRKHLILVHVHSRCFVWWNNWQWWEWRLSWPVGPLLISDPYWFDSWSSCNLSLELSAIRSQLTNRFCTLNDQIYHWYWYRYQQR